MTIVEAPVSHLRENPFEIAQQQLRRVVKEAADLSIAMRTQLAEYAMLPPLQPEYDDDGDLVEPFTFNAAMMNEATGGGGGGGGGNGGPAEQASSLAPPDSTSTTASNTELEAQSAIVRTVLFPVVVKKGDDQGAGEDDVVVFRAEVLVARDARNRPVSSPTPMSPSSFGMTASPGGV